MLNAFIWLPIIGAILIAYTPLEAKKVRGLALTLSVVLLLLNILLGWQFDPSNPQMQFTVNLPWINFLGFNYALGVDGLSFSLLFLNSILTIIALYASGTEVNRPRFYYSRKSFHAHTLLFYILYPSLHYRSAGKTASNIFVIINVFVI